MTDRELLELAAKAAVVKGVYMSLDSDFKGEFSEGISEHYGYKWWNPLTDDGDAFRLAVRLELHVLKGIAQTPDGNMHFEKDEGDPYADTRRAIVLAAAEIGKAMP